MSLLIRPPTEDLHLPTRLAALGHARRVAVVCAAGFAVVSVTIALVTLFCTLDVWLRLSAAVRALFLVATLGTVGFLIVRRLFPAFREPTHPLAIAMRLEDRFPTLNDSVASAIEFESSDRFGSKRFRQVATKRAENLLNRCDPDVIVPAGKAWRGLWLALLAFVVLLPLGLMNTSRAGLVLARFADPFGAHPWPKQTAIILVEPSVLPARIAKGEAVGIKVVVRGVVPPQATLALKFGDQPETTEPLSLQVQEATAEGVGELILDAGRATKDFSFRITANDADTGWQFVAVAPPPKLVPYDGRPSPLVRLIYPAYTGLPVADLPDGSAVVEAVAGTHVAILAAADKPIARAVLRPLADPAPYQTAAAVAPLAALANPFAALAEQVLADSYTDDIPVTVSKETRLAATFVPRISGLHALRFTDASGLTGVRLFDLRTFPDPTPTVILDRPAVGKDTLTLLPAASVEIQTRADDRTFGIRRLVLEYRVGPDADFRTLPLVEFDTHVGIAIGGPVAGMIHPSPTTADAARVFKLSSFVKPDGTPPKDGDVITLRTAAEDWDDVTILKDPGRSVEVDIHVVSRASLDAVLQKGTADLRPELRRAALLHQDAMRKTQDAGKPETPNTEVRDRLAIAAQAEREAAARVGDPRDGLRAKAEELRQMARTNGATNTPAGQKAEAIAAALSNLADKHLDPIEPLLDVARTAADRMGADPAAAKELKAALADAQGKQASATAEFQKVLEQLDRWGGAAEVGGEARSIKEEILSAGAAAAKPLAGLKPGESPDSLSPTNKAELGKSADRLDRAADDANALLDKAGRIAAEKEKLAADLRAEAGTNPEAAAKADAVAAEAKALREAIQKAGGQAVANETRAAAQALRQNRPGESAADRNSAADRLDKLTNALAEKGPESPSAEEMAKKKKEAASEIAKLKEEQDELRKKAKEADQIPDLAERKTALDKLAKEQEDLAKKVEQQAERLTREKSPKPADDLKRAAEEMHQAAKQLEQGKQPDAEQQDALDRLNEAKKDLEQEKKENEDQLSREKKEELLEQFKGFRDRQAAAVTEAERITAAAVKAKQWERPLQASLTDLEDGQKRLSLELTGFVEKNLAELPVFNRMATQAADAMGKAATRLADRKDDILTADPAAAFDPETEKIAHGRVARPMALALKRLDQILDAVKPDEKKPGGNGGGGGEGGGEPMGGGGGEGGPKQGGIPALAQLKALRSLQADLVDRTAAFHKENPDPEKHTDDQKDELKDLEQGQREVAELFEKLLPLFQPKVDGDGQ